MRLLMVVAGLLLAACGESKSVQIAKCELEARRIYPGTDPATFPFVAWATELCMTAQEWVFDPQDGQCARAPAPEQLAVCYRGRRYDEITKAWLGAD